jgi:D-alanine-D-alanine ligase
MTAFKADSVNLTYKKGTWFFPQDPAVYGKVAVLMGGVSAECGISLQSGETIVTSLREAGVDAHALVVSEGLEWLDIVRGNEFDRAFIALHGPWGEDGYCQAVLETLNIPYTGSGMLASAIAMHKIKAKEIFIQNNIQTPRFQYLNDNTDPKELFSKLRAPIAIKPSCQGSTIGISRIDTPDQFAAAYEEAKRYDKVIFAEEWIEGGEYTVPILGKQVLNSIKITPTNEYYDFDAKYISEQTRFDCPSDLNKEEELAIRDLALRAYEALGCNGWGRVDLMRDKNGQFWVLEVNTIPGMTSHSLVPMGAKAEGYSLSELCLAILASSLDEAELEELESHAQEPVSLRA